MIVDIWQNSRRRTREPRDICQDCQIFVARGWGKISLLFIEIAPQGADLGDLLVSGIRYRRFPDVVRGVHFAPLSHEF